MDPDNAPLVNRYIQKPIEACLITEDNMQAVADWCGGELYDKNEEVESLKGDFNLDTGSKTITADVGDYIIKAGSGSFYKVSAESFKELYESIWW